MTSFTGASGARIADREYFDLILSLAESARCRIYASIFLIDVRPVCDVRGQVLDLVTALAERRRLGVDVRVLATGQVETLVLGVANVATGILLASYDVPHRRVFEVGAVRQGSHAKFAIFDDVGVVGSQNWAVDAFNDNTEDAVLLSGPAVDLMESEFFRLWRIGKGLPAYESA
jgi:phosphatidylserine/phosphatidylglycerophosphate/cardiolipin synthase-like enzyme